MRKAGCALAVVLSLIAVSTAHAQGTQRSARPPVDYAAFMRQDNQQRLRTFNRLTTQERTDLMLTGIQRHSRMARGCGTAPQNYLRDRSGTSMRRRMTQPCD